MTKHLSVRIVWHDRGWDGCICDNPNKNTFCYGDHSVDIMKIREKRLDPTHLEWEIKNKGKPIDELDQLPPCTWTVNTYSKRTIPHIHSPKDFMEIQDGITEIPDKMPPASTGTWCFDQMYYDIPHGEKRYSKKHAEKREKLSKQFFQNFQKDKSLVFTYLNYDNALNPENKNYVVVGISRLKKISDQKKWLGMNQKYKDQWGDIIWSRTVETHYPKEGVKIPYQDYLKLGKDITPILFEISGELARRFKYVCRDLSDDDACLLIERMIEIIQQVKKDNLVEDDWEYKLLWLNTILSEVWRERGLYPGIGSVLEYLDFSTGTTYFKQFLKPKEKNGTDLRDYIMKILNCEQPVDKDYSREWGRAKKRWKFISETKRNLLAKICLFELNLYQINNILSSDRSNYCITSSLEEISNNPYIICEEYVGEDEDDVISFDKIDNGLFPSEELPCEGDFDLNSPERIRALIVERLRKEKNDGNTFLPAEIVFSDIKDKCIDWRKCNMDIERIMMDLDIIEKKIKLVEIGGRHYLFLKRNWEYERIIEKIIKELITRNDFEPSGIDWRKKITELFPDSNIPPDKLPIVLKEQSDALEKAFQKTISVINGSAGTGKSTIIKLLIKGIEEIEGRQRFILLAPTGKASVRLKNITERKAQTIHRILMSHGWINDYNFTFYEQSSDQIVADNIILDETSMIDLELLGTLLKSINWNRVKRFILVGDPNQLPPIGFGKPFFDIISYLDNNHKDNIIELTQNLRQMETHSTVLELANIFTNGNIDVNETVLNKIARGGPIGTDLKVVYWKNEEDLCKYIIKELNSLLKEEFQTSDYQSALNKLLGMDSINNQYSLEYYQLLTPFRGYYYGTMEINRILQDEYRSNNLNNYGKLSKFTLMDKVIQEYNERLKDYEGKTTYVFNGELGYVRSTYPKRKPRLINILFKSDEEKHIQYNKDLADENIELGYAISIHKSQGSEFQEIFLIIPKENLSLLSKELIYTALTRSRKKVTLFLQEDISPLLIASKPISSAIVARNSSLFEFKYITTEYKLHPENLIHITSRKDKLEIVRSKSELIIANRLLANGIDYEYEQQLDGKDGDFLLPDFTIHYKGKEYYWEHQGIQDDEKYLKRQKYKQIWYEQNGIVGRLIITKEEGGKFNSRKIDEIIETYFP